MSDSDRKWSRIAWAAIAAGALVRLVFILVIHPPYEYVFSDMQGYVNRAVELASGADLHRSDALYPPGTQIVLSVPLFLLDTGQKGLRGAAVLWWALSSATVFFVWRLALRLLTPAAAAVAAVVCAAYPLFVFYGGFFSSETPGMAFLLAALWLGYRSRDVTGRSAVLSAVGAGVLGGCAVAIRPQFLLNLVVVGVAMRAAPRFRRLPAPALLAAGAVVILAGVIALNSTAAGRLVGVNENGAHQFYQSHCDIHLITMGSPDRGGVFSFGGPVAFQKNRGHDVTFPDHEPWDQGFFVKEGLRCIGDDGLGHLGVLAQNALDATATTTPFPFGSPPSLVTPARAANIAYCVLIMLTIIGAVALPKRRRAWLRTGERQLLIHLACFLPVILVFLSEPRYRIPYDVFGLMLMASLAVTLAPEARRRVAPRSAGMPRSSAE